MFTWSEFIATAADLNGLPSTLADPDSRGGSVELNFNGWWDFRGEWADPPYEAAILTLRNGASAVLEQWHLNRFAPPGSTPTGATRPASGPSAGSTPPQRSSTAC